MADDNKQSAGGTVTATLTIPDEVKKHFPDLVKMILGSESMDDEERKYWFSVLPIMTKDQISELRDILVTEKKKLAEIDTKYSDGSGSGSSTGQNEGSAISDEAIKKAEERRKLAKQERKKKELEQQKKAEEDAENILAELDEL